MTTATTQAAPNIAFIKYRLAKLGRTNSKVCFGDEIILYKEWFNALRLGIEGTGAFFLGDPARADRLGAKARQA